MENPNSIEQIWIESTVSHDGVYKVGDNKIMIVHDSRCGILTCAQWLEAVDLWSAEKYLKPTKQPAEKTEEGGKA